MQRDKRKKTGKGKEVVGEFDKQKNKFGRKTLYQSFQANARAHKERRGQCES